MSATIDDRLMFLSWECPWPAHSGGSLRTLGLLQQLSKTFEVELVVISRAPLSREQQLHLRSFAARVSRVLLKDLSPVDKASTLWLMLATGYPYHCSILKRSMEGYPQVLRRILEFPGVVYASYGHWGSLILNRRSPNWILDQQNADVQFWRVYASQVSQPFTKLAALANWRLSDRHFRQVYGHVGRVVSVCEEDRRLTLELAPHVPVDVIENGVDCSYYHPTRTDRSGQPRLLFTGTSAARNVTALRQFVHSVFPLICAQQPDVELLVAGDFSRKAQSELRHHSAIRFTGRVDDIRPFFNDSDVFIAPFEETHGSKLKVAEAMAMGMSIVATPEGARGFPLVHNESVLIARKNEEFAAHVIALLNDPIRREKMGNAARTVAEQNIDWAVLGKRLVDIVRSVQLACRNGGGNPFESPGGGQG